MNTPKQVAEYLLSLSDPDIGDTISNLKLQKLVYYAQGFHLAMYGKPIFDEDVVAWEHGPVVESLYHKYKKHGSGAIPIPESVNTKVFSKKQIELLNEVFEVYGQFSGWKLRNMTHSEKPWSATIKNRTISPKLMKEYFKGRLT